MRTKKALNNIITSVGLTLIIGILGFIKVKVFVGGLSNDIYSLNQLFYQIFSYLTITDIGFGFLLNKALYDAFSKNDHDEINKIYSTSKKFYKTIGMIMIVLALIISFFVKYLTKANVNVYYIQLIFIIFIIKNVIDYFFIAPRFVLDADGKMYKVNFLLKSIRIIETITEIILVLMGVNYIIILLPGIFLTLIIDYYINKKIYKIYPWLENGKTFDKKYLKGTKDIIWRKGADLLNSNTDIILLSALIDPLRVIIYTSYIYITKFICDVIYLIQSSITPIFANTILIESKEKSMNVFHEISIMFLFIASFINIMLFGFFNGLITYWVGTKYLVNSITLALFCLSTFQIIANYPINIVINSKGLFKETKISAIAEAIVNITLSIILIKPFGLMGVLIGTIVAKLMTSFIQNPYYIYHNVFNKKSINYFLIYGIIVLINAGFMFGFNAISLTYYGIFDWIIKVIVFSLLVAICLFIIFYILFKSFRMLVNRGIKFIKYHGKFEVEEA